MNHNCHQVAQVSVLSFFSFVKIGVDWVLLFYLLGCGLCAGLCGRVYGVVDGRGLGSMLGTVTRDSVPVRRGCLGVLVISPGVGACVAWVHVLFCGQAGWGC